MFLAWCVWSLSGSTPNASFKGLCQCWTKRSHQPSCFDTCAPSLWPIAGALATPQEQQSSGRPTHGLHQGIIWAWWWFVATEIVLHSPIPRVAKTSNSPVPKGFVRFTVLLLFWSQSSFLSKQELVFTQLAWHETHLPRLFGSHV